MSHIHRKYTLNGEAPIAFLGFINIQKAHNYIDYRMYPLDVERGQQMSCVRPDEEALPEPIGVIQP